MLINYVLNLGYGIYMILDNVDLLLFLDEEEARFYAFFLIDFLNEDFIKLKSLTIHFLSCFWLSLWIHATKYD